MRDTRGKTTADEPVPLVHITATEPDGEPLGSWTTSETGEHTPDEPAPVDVDALEIENLRTAVDYMLVAPWRGGDHVQWAITLACAVRHHPRIKGESNRPCYCGMVKP